jgi:hypothetical protein
MKSRSAQAACPSVSGEGGAVGHGHAAALPGMRVACSLSGAMRFPAVIPVVDKYFMFRKPMHRLPTALRQQAAYNEAHHQSTSQPAFYVSYA